MKGEGKDCRCKSLRGRDEQVGPSRLHPLDEDFDLCHAEMTALFERIEAD